VTEVLRARLDDEAVEFVDEGGLVLSQTPAYDPGDPVVRRRDGVLAYQLVVVVDDGDQGVNRVVRGRDIATSTATQVLLQRLLGLPQPAYRHHLLLVEPARLGPAAAPDEPAAPRHDVIGEAEPTRAPGGGLTKLAKLHGSIPFSEVRTRHSGAQLCGLLAHAIGLLDEPRAMTPAELVASFTWQRVRSRDLVATWSQERGLELGDDLSQSRHPTGVRI
jgi:hypothetical protein